LLETIQNYVHTFLIDGGAQQVPSVRLDKVAIPVNTFFGKDFVAPTARGTKTGKLETSEVEAT
jgi:hypothetical protein